MSAIQEVADLVVYANALLSLSFIAEYHVMSRGQWRRSVTGKLLMGWVFVHLSIFAMLTAAHVWPWLATQAWYQWLYVATVGTISLTIAGFGVVLWRVNQPMPSDPSRDRTTVRKDTS